MTGGLDVAGEVLFHAMLGAMAGASVGVAQWPVLRRQVSRAGWWVLASIVGLAVGFAAAFTVVAAVVGAVVEAGAFGAVVGAVLGASLGIAQWLVLRRQVSQADWWVLASIVSLAVGFAVVMAVIGVVVRAMAVGWAFIVGPAVGGAVGGAIYGAITGGVLVWLLRQPVSEESSLPQDVTKPELERVKWGVWALMGVGALALAFFFRSQGWPRAQAREHFSQASSYGVQGNDDLAIEEYSKAIALDPEYIEAYTRRGYLYGSMGDVDNAIADFEQAIALDPENVYAYSNLGDLYAKRGEFDRAVSAVEKAIELNQDAGIRRYSPPGMLEAQLEVIEMMRERASTPTGWVDAANCQQIAGWAWDPKTPNQPIEIEIYDLSDDGTEEVLLRTLAGLYRPDLPPALGDNGIHAFDVTTPFALRDRNIHTVRVYAVNSDDRFPDQILFGSDVQIQCP
jgi:hypothetical protein